MKPGATTSPSAWITRRPLSGATETLAIFPSRIPTLRTASSPVSGSMMRPPSTTTSYCCAAAKVPETTRARAIIRLRMESPKSATEVSDHSRPTHTYRCGSRTLMVSLEDHCTNTDALHGLDHGPDERAGDLGPVCDRVR